VYPTTLEVYTAPGGGWQLGVPWAYGRLDTVCPVRLPKIGADSLWRA
jgi:hypothetical protein